MRVIDGVVHCRCGKSYGFHTLDVMPKDDLRELFQYCEDMSGKAWTDSANDAYQDCSDRIKELLIKRGE